MSDATPFESKQQAKYPGLTVSRDGDAVIVRIPLQLRRRNGRQMVLTQGGNEGDIAPERATNNSLATAIAKAYRWQQQLESGEYTSLDDLAAANGIDRSYLGRILRLTSLAPDIVEAILAGDEPEGLSLAKLRADLPVVWAEQVWR